MIDAIMIVIITSLIEGTILTIIESEITNITQKMTISMKKERPRQTTG